ncbi:MAG TPA: radical SAM protein [Spirochaetia bacterium]|nr:radical SAM protein [Spirochaetia bacterium]
MDRPLDILGLCSGELAAEAARRLGSGAGVAGRVYARAFETGRLEPEAFGLSAVSCRAWRESFRVGLLEPVALVEEEGGAGITAKALLRAEDGSEIECVRIPMRGAAAGEGPRFTLCLSSQVGCRMGCAFCETGRGGLVRGLSAAEIVSQVLSARILLGWDCRNLVFMGMGEPFDNFPELARALAVLLDPRGPGYAQERITVCTSGQVEGIRALRALGYKRLGLSVSLNAGEDEKRARLMPIARRWGLAELAAALRDYPQRRNFALGVNYCLLPGINDGREDAAAVARFCASIGRCLVNLIPYNPGRAPIARAPSAEEEERFQGWLAEEGLLVRAREAKGGSIMAACGQLGGGPCPAAGGAAGA